MPSLSKCRLNLQALDARDVPATFTFNAGTLAVVAANSDVITVSDSMDAPLGFLNLNDGGNNSFDSLTKGQAVKNVIVTFAGVNSGAVLITDGTLIPGNLTIVAGKASSFVQDKGTVGGNFSFQSASSSAGDLVTLDGAVGGNTTIKLGGGTNEFDLEGGNIGGNLNVTAGAGADTIKLTSTGEVVVKGFATFNLGSGKNDVLSAGNDEFIVAKDFKYIGGSGEDTIDLNTATKTPLSIFGKLTIALGAATGGQNFVDTVDVSAGNSVSITGGNNADVIQMFGTINFGSGCTIALGDGTNAALLEGVSTGGGLTYTGGLDRDNFQLDSFLIDKNLSVNLKGNRAKVDQFLSLGTMSTDFNAILGSATLTGGDTVDHVLVHRLAVGGNLKVTTGAGADVVHINDTAIAGTTAIDLGTAGDVLDVDNQDFDAAGALGGNTTFGGTFTCKAGDGNDSVHLSSDAGNIAKFGGKVSLFGGAGTDTFDNTVLNIFFSTGNTEDFETNAGAALPA